MANTYLPWIILLFAAFNVIFLGGKRRAFGIFVSELHVEFKQTSLVTLNWIGDSYAALGYLSSTLSSAIILHYDRRYRLFQFVGSCFVLAACLTSAQVSSPGWLFLTHTILHGIGSSFILSTIGLVVNEHFDKDHKYHLLATTLVSGGSVASIVFVQFYAYLIETYGWRKSFIILGWLYFSINATSAILFIKNASKNVDHKRKCSLNCWDVVKPGQTPLLILWTLDRILTSVVTYGILLNLADYMRQSETNLQKAAVLTTLFAAGEASTYAIGAIVTAVTKDILKNRLKYILLICTLLMAFCLLAWEIFANNTFVRHYLAYLSGFFLGPSITFLFPAGEEMTALPGHFAYPFTLAGMGIGMLLSPLLSAYVAQLFNYKWFFLVQAILISVKFVCLLLSTWYLKYIYIGVRVIEEEKFEQSEMDLLRNNHSISPVVKRIKSVEEV